MREGAREGGWEEGLVDGLAGSRKMMLHQPILSLPPSLPSPLPPPPIPLSPKTRPSSGTGSASRCHRQTPHASPSSRNTPPPSPPPSPSLPPHMSEGCTTCAQGYTLPCLSPLPFPLSPFSTRTRLQARPAEASSCTEGGRRRGLGEGGREEDLG